MHAQADSSLLGYFRILLVRVDVVVRGSNGWKY